ncbi:MAG: chorismate-binding protein [Bacteroidales bacterium]|nr:chorismate-binding protein [Bacteroidales bacterium]
MQESIKQAIRNSLKFGYSFYAYSTRDGFVFGAQIDDDFTGTNGFKIVPFTDSGANGITIFRQYDETDLPTSSADKQLKPVAALSTPKSDYIDCLSDCISTIRTSPTLRKVVISRVIKRAISDVDWPGFIEQLHDKNPDSFTFIYNTPHSGVWIGVSPEIIGDYSDGKFSTMALAGTRLKGESVWSAKDIEEQEFVSNYIAERIKNAGFDYTVSDKFTLPAGNVEHICNMFTVRESDIRKMLDLVDLLHPTPALAGTPKDEAVEYILSLEHHNRECYGGYIGPFDAQSFHFAVNLRSMCFDERTVAVFVGSGITDKSIPESEYAETQAKSEIILKNLDRLRFANNKK